MRLSACMVAMMLAACFAWAQNWSVSSNMIGLADMGTLNASASYAVAKH